MAERAGSLSQPQAGIDPRRRGKRAGSSTGAIRVASDVGVFFRGIAALSAVVACSPALGDGAAPVRHQVHIEGSGSRTVVFESGLGDTLEVWQTIQSRVAANCARTFAYTRAGYPGSDPAPGTRDAATVVDELRAELQYRHVAPPYVLVGHSLGGLYMQYFARNHPADVAGLVLIDSTHWQQAMTVDAAANTPYQSRTAVTLFMPLIMRQELADSTAAGHEVYTSPSAVAMPTIVLSSTRGAAGATSEQRTRADALQNEIAAGFPGSRHEFVANSGHYIQRDQPGTVIDAIRDLAGCEHRGSAR